MFVTPSSWRPSIQPSIRSFIQLAVCLTTGPKPLPKPDFHTVRSRSSSFTWQ